MEKKFKGLNGIYNLLFGRVLVYLCKKKTWVFKLVMPIKSKLAQMACGKTYYIDFKAPRIFIDILINK